MNENKNCSCRSFSALALLALALPLLQGCFPIVAAGVGAGALAVEDRRTTGTFVEDQSIELKAAGKLDVALGNRAHVNVTSYNRNVLLTGEARDEQTKAQAESVVREVPQVRNVVNELAIRPNRSLASYGNDAYLTSKVKARMIEAQRFQINHVKVVSEDGVVYLLGLVTRKEAHDAAEIARTTSGVTKVVKIFELLD